MGSGTLGSLLGTHDQVQDLGADVNAEDFGGQLCKRYRLFRKDIV